MKKNLKESLAKMKYHAGIISESQYLKEFEGEELEKEVPDDYKFNQKSYFKEEGFSPESEEDTSALFHALTKEGVTDLSFYPEWVFKALQEDNYVEQEAGTGAWFLSIEGQSVFRNPLKFQQYLITADESTPETVSETDNTTEGIEGRPGNYPSGQEHIAPVNEIGDPTQMINYYAHQLDRIKPGTVEFSPAIKIEARGNGSDTKWINLNEQSAEALVTWLTQNFLNKV